jgi:HK97 family phage major capsid protein
VAITAATTIASNFSGFLTPAQSAPVFDLTRKKSVVQSLAKQIPLGISGQSIPYSATKPTAGWVAEGAQKPATSGTLALETMTPKKLAAILVVSAEVVRANPGGYMETSREDLAEAFAIAFDAAVLHGTSTPFAHYVDETTKTVELGTATAANGGVYADINAGLKLLVDAGKRGTGFAWDIRAEPVINASVDANGRPLFVDSPMVDTNPAVRPGRMLGREAVMGETVYGSGDSTVGYLGDWSQIAWGVVGGISYKVSTEATVTINGSLVSLFEKNLVAVLAEAEYGCVVHDKDAFVQYTNAS